MSRRGHRLECGSEWNYSGTTPVLERGLRSRVSEDERAASMTVALDELLVDAKLSVPPPRPGS